MAILPMNHFLEHTLEDEAKYVKGPLAALGAVVVTNPVDFIHIEYIKSEGRVSISEIIKSSGFRLFSRGLGSNIVAVTLPVSITIFITDIFKSWKYGKDNKPRHWS